MTRTRDPPRRISWVAEVLEREGWHGGEAEEVDEVVDRKCWTLHRLDSTKISKLVFVQGKFPNNEMVRRETQSPFASIQCLRTPDIFRSEENLAPKVYIPFEEGSWAGPGVNDFDSRVWWTEDVERRRMRT